MSESFHSCCLYKKIIHKYLFSFQSFEHIKYNTNHIFLQVQQRDDYTCLLNRIEELADIKDGEAKQYVILFLYLHSFMYFLYVAMVIWIHMIDFFDLWAVAYPICRRISQVQILLLWGIFTWSNYNFTIKNHVQNTLQKN